MGFIPRANTLNHDHGLSCKRLGEMRVYEPLFEVSLGQYPLVLPVEILAGLQTLCPGGYHNCAVPQLNLRAVRLQDRAAVLAFVTCDLAHFCLGKDLDPRIGGYSGDDLPQQLLRIFSRPGSSVDMAQIASQLCLPFNQEDLKALPGDGKGSSHPCQPAADHQGAPVDIEGAVLQSVQLARLGNCHGSQLFGFAGCDLRVAFMHPRVLLTNIGHFEQVRIQACLAQGILE